MNGTVSREPETRGVVVRVIVDVVHLRGLVDDVLGVGFLVDSEIVTNDVFPPGNPVSCRISDLQQPGNGLLLGETGHLFDEVQECFSHYRTLPLRSTSPIDSTRRCLRIRYTRIWPNGQLNVYPFISRCAQCSRHEVIIYLDVC